MGTYSDPALILPASVGTLALADGAVTTLKIADANVTTGKIDDGDITTVKIADANVTTDKIANSAVTTAKIADANVTTDKIATSAVTTAKIADANVTTDKIANSAVTTAKIADANVTTGKIASGAITQTLVDSSLKRDTANGVAGLDSNGSCIVPGNALWLTRNGSGDSILVDRTSAEVILQFRRVSANNYTFYGIVNGSSQLLVSRNEVNFGSSIGSGSGFTIPSGYTSPHRFIVNVRWSCGTDGTNLYFHLAKNGTKISGTYGMAVDQYVENIDTPIEFYAVTGDVLTIVSSGTGAINSVTFYA